VPLENGRLTGISTWPKPRLLDLGRRGTDAEKLAVLAELLRRDDLRQQRKRVRAEKAR
jgi:hypothetical protein